MKKALLAPLGVLLLLALTACGGGNGLNKVVKSGPYAGLTKEGSLVATAMATSITRPSDGLLDKTAAECVAKKVVADIGVTGLRTAGSVTAANTYNANGANVNATTSAAYTKALLSCVDQAAAVEKIKAAIITNSQGGAMTTAQVTCYAEKVVKGVDVAHLMSSRVITDSGEVGTETQPDVATATSVTDAVLTCADYYKLQALGIAKQGLAGFKQGVFASCLRAEVPRSELRAFLIAVQANTPDLADLSKTIGAKTAACQKSALPAKKKK